MDNDDLNIKEITEDDNDLIIKVGDKAGSEKGKKGKKARFYAILSVIFFICAIILLSVFIVRKINYDKKQQAFEELNKSAEKTDEIQYILNSIAIIFKISCTLSNFIRCWIWKSYFHIVPVFFLILIVFFHY